MEAVLWSDYVCPWCYLGRDRTSLMEQLGVSVRHRSFELHPEIPAEGVAVRSGGRLEAVLRRIAAECADVGLPFVMPRRMPRSRRALETVEVVSARWPAAFAALDGALFDAVFVTERDIADPRVLDELVDAAGAPVDEVRAAVDAGEGASLLAASMLEANEHGITATPAWRLDNGLVIPGAQPRELITRWIEKIRARTH